MAQKRYDSSNRWDRENPELRKEVVRKSNAKAYARNRAIVLAAKKVPCADCGRCYSPVVMDFDHVRGTKRFNIGRNGGRGSITRLKAELAKCEVVCANCHRERHA